MEPFTSVRLREQVPVVRQTSCLFIALAIQIHWTVAERQIMYRPAMVNHCVANLDRLISIRNTVTPNAEQIFRRIRRSCIPCRKQSNKTVPHKSGNLRMCAIVPNNPFRVCCLNISGQWVVLKSKKGKEREQTRTQPK